MAHRTSKLRYVLAILALQVLGVVLLLILGRGLPSVVGFLIGVNAGLLVMWVLSKRRKTPHDH